MKATITFDVEVDNPFYHLVEEREEVFDPVFFMREVESIYYNDYTTVTNIGVKMDDEMLAYDISGIKCCCGHAVSEHGTDGYDNCGVDGCNCFNAHLREDCVVGGQHESSPEPVVTPVQRGAARLWGVLPGEVEVVSDVEGPRGGRTVRLKCGRKSLTAKGDVLKLLEKEGAR